MDSRGFRISHSVATRLDRSPRCRPTEVVPGQTKTSLEVGKRHTRDSAYPRGFDDGSSAAGTQRGNQTPVPPDIVTALMHSTPETSATPKLTPSELAVESRNIAANRDASFSATSPAPPTALGFREGSRKIQLPSGRPAPVKT